MLRFRVKLRRAIVTLSLISISSFVMLAFWFNVKSNQLLLRLSLNNANYMRLANNNATAMAVDERHTYRVTFELPWFVFNGTERPDAKQPFYSDLHLFPSVYNLNDDRIVNQLMYIPFNFDNGVKVNDDGKVEKNTKKVLLNMETGGWNIHEMQLGQSAFAECPVNNCELIADSDFAETADAVIFKDRFQLPKYKRPSNQVWILYLLECPLHTQSFQEANNLINWTATYRHDSDLVTPYEKFVSYGNTRFAKKSTKNYAKGKTKKVAWFVSNCGAKNNRLQYAKQLKKYIEVDIFGSCGDKICSRSRQQSCFEMLNNDYKFYLAFENSNCRDYITEKFYVNGLKNDILPITMGAHPADYERSAPYHSFIHVDHFDSPKELADYLHKLDSNDTLYNSYFAWKQTGEFINTRFWCRLCAMLHSNYKAKVYPRLNDWWSNPNICKQREHSFKWENYLKDAFPNPL